ncbi:MAG: LysR family transcriptional regulator [Lachnospiraceae bacterium]|nr:LysR family transcriptional regulator [Lachnospiraceae bacterium]
MDLKQIEYMVKIADEHSITRAAEKLYLTQSALNQQLLRLERELGAQLFRRSRTDWSPTPIGEVYLENAREILRIKHRTYNMISDMLEEKKGRLSIGFTPGRGLEMFTKVYPAFHKACPGIVVEPKELNVRSQQLMIARGDLDIGFQTLSEQQKTEDEYISLGREEILLAVPSGHPLAEEAVGDRRYIENVRRQDSKEHRRKPLAGSLEGAGEGKQGLEEFPVIDLGLFRYEPFVLMYRESTVRAIIDGLFRKSGFTPNILFETASNSAIVAMVQSKQCCGIVPYHYVKHYPEGVTCFSLSGHPQWEIVASYQRNTYLSDAAREFVRLAGEFWSSEEL